MPGGERVDQRVDGPVVRGGGRWRALAAGTFWVVVLDALALLSGPGWHWVLVVSPLAYVGAWWLLPATALTVEGEAIVLRARGSVHRVDIRRLASVRRTWGPPTGDRLTFRDADGGWVDLQDLGEGSQAFRREVGRRMVAAGVRAPVDRRTRELLGLPDPWPPPRLGNVGAP